MFLYNIFCTKAAVNLLIPTTMLKTMMYCYTKYDCENIHVMYVFYSINLRMRVCLFARDFCFENCPNPRLLEI